MPNGFPVPFTLGRLSNPLPSFLGNRQADMTGKDTQSQSHPVTHRWYCRVVAKAGWEQLSVLWFLSKLGLGKTARGIASYALVIFL